jgi:2-oxoisovalerate dehydrogenase E2 component (dihydrolipoyl transacylase)
MKTFYLPDLGEGLAEAEITEWHVAEGDIVKVDQPLVCMETAKANVEVPSPYLGKILKLHGKKGDIIKTHAPLVEFENEVETIKDKGTVVGSLEESSHILAEGDMIIGTANKPIDGSIKAMPAVRALAKTLNIDLYSVTASGPQGQITTEDIRNFSQQSAVSPFAKQATNKDAAVETLKGVRRTMAIAMTQSHQEIVPVTLIDDADITHLSATADITVCVLQAMVAAVKSEPALNAWYDGKTMERCLHHKIHIGIAMDTKEGLFVPVIKNASEKSDQELRTIIDTFKLSTRDRSIPVTELQGATITLSNFGMFAGRYATPIIVPPMVAILACGRVRDEVRAYQGDIAIRRILPLSLTFDHRAVTGGEASRFLARLIQYLEQDAQ